MTAEQKIAGKHDTQLELEVRQWLQEVTGEPFPTGLDPSAQTFHEGLKDGLYLCNAINALQPGSAEKVNNSKMAFKMMENIGNFLSSCEAYGVPKGDLFQTVDLYESQNLPQVMNGIIALARKAEGQKREFTEEQLLQAGRGIIGLQMGSNQGASQAGMTPYGDRLIRPT